MPTQGFAERIRLFAEGGRLPRGWWRWWRWPAAANAAVLFAALSAPVAGQPKETLQLSMEPVHQRAVDAALYAGEKIVEGYRKSPVLVLGLALAGIVPVLAGCLTAARVLRRRRKNECAGAGTPRPTEGARAGDKAWIETSSAADDMKVVFSGELFRIGRHSDNDLPLDHASVHRHHALIQRTPDHEFLLIDLTAGTGNPLLHNGAAVERAMLRNGDQFTLGETTLTFRIGAEAPVSARAPIHELQPPTRRLTDRTPMEIEHGQRIAADEPTGRAADSVQTRRLGKADRLAARGADRRRS
jgi:hypothetical protein